MAQEGARILMEHHCSCRHHTIVFTTRALGYVAFPFLQWFSSRCHEYNRFERPMPRILRITARTCAAALVDSLRICRHRHTCLLEFFAHTNDEPSFYHYHRGNNPPCASSVFRKESCTTALHELDPMACSIVSGSFPHIFRPLPSQTCFPRGSPRTRQH